MHLLKKIYFQIFYFGKPPWDTGISPPELHAFIKEHPPGRALDLGCGTGTNAITLAQNQWNVVAIDFISSAIRAARKKARRAGVNVDFHVDDVTKYKDVNGVFDLVLDIGCFHSLSKPQKIIYINNLRHLLSPSGIFLSYTFIKNDIHGSLGTDENDLETMQKFLKLIDRQDGMGRGDLPSAWLTFTRQK